MSAVVQIPSLRPISKPGLGWTSLLNTTQREHGRRLRSWIIRAYEKAEEMGVPPPTGLEIASMFRISKTRAGHHIAVLRGMGILRRGAGNRYHLVARSVAA